MNKLTFDTLQDAKEFSAIAKKQGYEVSKPTKIKRPQGARKMYDLNGHLVLHRYQIMMGAKGVGKKGGKRGASKEEHWEDMERHSVDIKELKHKTKSGKEAYGRDTNGKTDRVSAIEPAEEEGKISGARHYYEGMEYGEQN